MQPWLSAIVRAAEMGKPPVFCVHYASDFTTLDNTPTVAVLAVRVLGFDQTRVFSLSLMAERRGLAPESIIAQRDDLERDLLEEWLCFVERMQTKYPEAYWVHWAMRDAVFGWPLLEHRSLKLLSRSVQMNDERLIDLHAKLAFEYGRNFVDQPRLLKLAELNHLGHAEVMTGLDEMAALTQGRFSQVARSTARKAEMLGHLALRYAQGHLLINRFNQPRLRKRPQRLAASVLARELIDADQASKVCGVSRATWYRLLAAAKIPLPHKLGKRTLWDARELRLWIDAQCPRWKLWIKERQQHGFRDHVGEAITRAIAGSAGKAHPRRKKLVA